MVIKSPAKFDGSPVRESVLSLMSYRVGECPCWWILFHQPTLMHNFLYSLTIYLLHYNPRHVSSINLPILRRKNCIHTATGIFVLCKLLHSTLVESGLSVRVGECVGGCACLWLSMLVSVHVCDCPCWWLSVFVTVHFGECLCLWLSVLISVLVSDCPCFVSKIDVNLLTVLGSTLNLILFSIGWI